MKKKLYRSRTQRMLGGVCGGIAEYFDIDPTLVRLLFVALTFIGGTGFFIYIVASIVIPEKPLSGEKDEHGTFVDAASVYDGVSSGRGAMIIGAVLIIIGLLSLVKKIVPQVWYYVKNMSWPVAFIIIGLAIIVMSLKKR